MRVPRNNLSQLIYSSQRRAQKRADRTPADQTQHAPSAPIKVSDKETTTVIAALTKQIRRLPTSLRRSLAWDLGHEMAKHKLFTLATNVKAYFFDPSSPWRRGSSENTNGLPRQYFPKGTDLFGHSRADPDSSRILGGIRGPAGSRRRAIASGRTCSDRCDTRPGRDRRFGVDDHRRHRQL